MHTVKRYSIGSDIRFFIRHYRRYEPAVLACCGAEILLGSLLPLFSVYLPKLAIDLVSQGTDTGRTVLVLGGFSLLLLVFRGIKDGVEHGKYILYNTQTTNLVGLLFLKSLRIRYSDVESGEVKKIYEKACSGAEAANSRMVTDTVALLIHLISFFLYSGLIGSLNVGMLAALLALSLVDYCMSMLQIRYEESLRGESATAWKHYGCVRGAMGDMSGAKDIRIFGMQDWMFQLRDLTIGELKKVDEKKKKNNSFYEKTRYTLAACRDLGAYAWLLYQAAAGALSAGEFVLYFGAITGFSNFLSGIMGAFASLRGAANDTDYLRAYLELPEEGGMREGNFMEEACELHFPPEIEFRNVSFSYGQAEPEIFRNLNLTIRPGEKIALVGANGAGKTTLVKLLCGLYEPDEGQILIGGVDRNLFPREELYRLFSAVFQEQLILPFTVGENLAMDRAERIDGRRAWEALNKAGLGDLFRQRGIGLKSYMTKVMMENGVELSGGERQRFLLARALYKDGPILVLDEPTAALDPIAESRIYARYNQYSQGKTALFISHRLASTRFSDRIVLLEKGRIAEMGTHEELMRAQGAYAKMYEIQSSYYRGKEEDGHRNGSTE